MSDQQPPAERDTAAVAGPDVAPGTAQEQAEVDWQKRYQDLQPEYTRTSQKAAELEQKQQWYELLVTSDDPDTRRQAAQVLGYELPEEEGLEEEFEPVEYDDPVDELRTRQQALEERLNQEQEAMRMAEQGALIREVVDERMGQFDGLPTKAQEWILAYAVNALPAVHEPGVPVPLPDLAQAHQAWQELQTEAQQSWAKTKQRAPRVMPGGVTADQVPDPGTGHESRMNRAMQFIHDNTDQE
jgi:hypothetical protein